MDREYHCLVVGGGHAGVEAALAASRMGCRTAMINLTRETIGLMSCNPAVGGVGKGQLVKEIDALGGEMGLAADKTAIQFRQLNASKGQAVRSSRCQSDRRRYQQYMQQAVCSQQDLTVIADMAEEILAVSGRVTGVKTASGLILSAPTVILAAGTFLKGRMHIGPRIIPGGRAGEPSAVRLTDNLKDLGFEIVYFKTGTPPRIDGKTVDFSRMHIQHSDPRPVPFSFRTDHIPDDHPLRPCFITRTTEQTHEIIRRNFHLSPMYSGQIEATGVRYCPSIEDKLKKFPDKGTHNVFMEPEGLETELYYPNGISTGLPEDVQQEMVHSIPGLDKAVITQPGYSIEHGVIPPTQITSSLESKQIKGLFLAGQINGTTGYEEAAAQGLVAGVNAVLAFRNEKPFILGRHESYIGVLIDDLTTKGTEEPYRMFTSRVEYRLVVREDNADVRMAPYARQHGLIREEEFDQIMKKYDRVESEIARLKAKKVFPGSDEGKALSAMLEANGSTRLSQPASLADILKRPQVHYTDLRSFGASLSEDERVQVEQVEYEIKYEGFIARQQKDIDRLRYVENIKIPEDMDYTRIPGLSIEIQQKLARFSPHTLAQAHRISGVTPSAVSILMVYLKKLSLARREQMRNE
ncbi:MAG: tRNA uridine-5-carboxymethylaminomethyl(34) synthesis enzyme MnmG [Candidatus Omnitrophota bacterium]